MSVCLVSGLGLSIRFFFFLSSFRPCKNSTKDRGAVNSNYGVIDGKATLGNGPRSGLYNQDSITVPCLAAHVAEARYLLAWYAMADASLCRVSLVMEQVFESHHPCWSKQSRQEMMQFLDGICLCPELGFGRYEKEKQSRRHCLGYFSFFLVLVPLEFLVHGIYKRQVLHREVLPPTGDGPSEGRWRGGMQSTTWH